MIRIAGLMNFDISDCDDGMTVSIWMQGCPHRCKGCHNPETWDPSRGKMFNYSELEKMLYNAMSILNDKCHKVNISILGGEPLYSENIVNTREIIKMIKRFDIPVNKFYLWTGYYYDTELKRIAKSNKDVKFILKNIDVLVDGRFELDKRDTTLKLRGSSNQKIYRRKYYFFNKFSKLVLNI